MWGIFIVVGVLFLTLVFSLARVSSRAEKITESHHKELLARKKSTKSKSDENL